MLEKLQGLIGFGVLSRDNTFLNASPAAERNVATARDCMTADMFLSLKHNDRRTPYGQKIETARKTSS